MALLQEENLRLKHLVVELTLDKAMLQDVLSKKGEAFTPWTHGGGTGGVVWRGRSVAAPECKR